MKINESSAECNAYNLKNQDSIAAGLMEPHEPADFILKQEEIQKQLVIKTGELKDTAINICKTFDPDMDMSKFHVSGGAYNRFYGELKGILFEILPEGNSYHSSVTGWRMIFGDRYSRLGTKKWMKIGNGEALGLTDAQIEKGKKILTELCAIQERQNDESSSALLAQKRKSEFFSNPENAFFIQLFTWSHYFSTGFEVTEEGKVIHQGLTLFPAQWFKLRALQDEHKAIEKKLIESFK